MDLKDLLVTPVVIFIVYVIAYIIRPAVSNKFTGRFFFPALTLKIIGALAVGFIYQFYYNGGDTFTYYNLGSVHIWEAFFDAPYKGLKLIFLDNRYSAETLKYAIRIYSFRDDPTYFIVRIAGFISLFTFNTYSSIAVCFAVISFSGLWAFYYALVNYFPYKKIYKELAIAIFFIPSVFFWGSGLLKDTITLGALAWANYALILIMHRRKIVSASVIFLLSMYIIYAVKIYILIGLLPALIIWVFVIKSRAIRSKALRIFVTPFVLSIALLLSYYIIFQIGQDSDRYSVGRLSQTAEVTAKYLQRISIEQGGAYYDLGDFDYSLNGIIRKFPTAVWVSLFRPYLWEVRNPVMLLSALESFGMLLFTIYILFKVGIRDVLRFSLKDPLILYGFVFSIFFAFAVGISTYNFGSLVRYKIPMIPFYIASLFLLRHYYLLGKKKSELEMV